MRALFCCLVLASLYSCGPKVPEGEPRNLLVLVFDTLNRDALAAFDEDAPKLKNFDRLAKRSARFQNALSASSWTLPAHASLFTGQYPDRHGVHHPTARLAKVIPTFGIQMRSKGFFNVGFHDGGFLAFEFGLNNGFVRWNARALTTPAHKLTEIPRDGLPTTMPGVFGFDRVIGFLEGYKPGRDPFFCFGQTFMVHDYFRGSLRELRNWGEYPDETSCQVDIVSGVLDGHDEDWIWLRQQYAARVEEADRALGRVLKALEKNGHLDETVIVVLSDHGEGFDPGRGRRHHGGRLDDDQIRIPLLISGPGIVPRDIETPFSLVDLAPTLLEFFGAEGLPNADGVAQAALLFGDDPNGRSKPHLAMEFGYEWVDGRRIAQRPAGERPKFASIDSRYWALVDSLGADPRIHDWKEHPTLQVEAEGVEKSVVEWLMLPLRERVGLGGEAEAVETNEELEEQLRALGYSN